MTQRWIPEAPVPLGRAGQVTVNRAIRPTGGGGDHQTFGPADLPRAGASSPASGRGALFRNPRALSLCYEASGVQFPLFRPLWGPFLLTRDPRAGLFPFHPWGRELLSAQYPVPLSQVLADPLATTRHPSPWTSWCQSHLRRRKTCTRPQEGQDIWEVMCPVEPSRAKEAFMVKTRSQLS